MNTNYLSISLKTVALTAMLAGGIGLRAATPAPTPVLNAPVGGPNQFSFVAFSDSAEAGMLHRAYHILATGDHDYKGHRAHAMHQVEAAADLLGLNLRGDARDRQPQPISDEKLREARGLLQNVLGSAEVKDQKRVSKHITEAISQIDVALSIR